MPTIHRFFVVLALGAVFLSGAAATSASPPTPFDPEAPVDLAPRWEEGQTARFGFTTRLQQAVEVTLGENRREQSTETDFAGELTWTVDQVSADGGSRCTMVLDWMSVDIRADAGGGGPVVESAVDSRKPAPAEQKLMHNLLRAMAGVPVAVTVAADGRVQQIRGLDAMKARCENPDLVPDELDFEETASGLAAFCAAPPPLKPGGNWKAAFRWNHELGHMDEDWTYKLGPVEFLGNVPVATITGSAKSRLEVDPEQLERPAGAPPVNIRLADREATTQILMDLDRREAVGRHSVATERVTVEVKLPGGVFRRVMNETDTSQLVRLTP